MNQAIDTSTGSETALAPLLGIISDELAELGQFTETLQNILSPSLLRLANNPECHRDVQMLDLLAQRLTVLSVFFVALGQSVPPELRIDAASALSAVTLSELAWRLRGQQATQHAHQPGELETF